MVTKDSTTETISGEKRLAACFDRLRAEGRTAFIPFITLGYPTLRMTEALVTGLAQRGADIIELGIPFSDPMADGPTIQASSEEALRRHVSLSDGFRLARRIRRHSHVPLVFMTYLNPVFHYGYKKFVEEAAASGVDGVIIPDWPPEEEVELRKLARRKGLATIGFVSPTTPQRRWLKIFQATRGFIYYLSLTGVTGERKSLPPDCARQVRRLREQSPWPVCVGFGISHRKQVQALSRVADGVVMGSALIRQIQAHQHRKDCVRRVVGFIRGLQR